MAACGWSEATGKPIPLGVSDITKMSVHYFYAIVFCAKTR